MDTEGRCFCEKAIVVAGLYRTVLFFETQSYDNVPSGTELHISHFKL